MNSTLGITDSVPGADVAALTKEEQSTEEKRVKKLGIIALLLLLTTFIPFLGFIGLALSLILSRRALRISRENLLSVEVEKPAYWASIISTTILVLFVVGLFAMILNS